MTPILYPRSPINSSSGLTVRDAVDHPGVVVAGEQGAVGHHLDVDRPAPCAPALQPAFGLDLLARDLVARDLNARDADRGAGANHQKSVGCYAGAAGVSTAADPAQPPPASTANLFAVMLA
jgi:hypothetical protein